MGSFFKSGQAVPEIFEFLCSIKRGVFLNKTYRELTYLTWHQKEDFWGSFYNFLGINTHNFVKNDSKFENKNLFDAKLYGACPEKIFRSQSFDIWRLGPKT